MLALTTETTIFLTTTAGIGMIASVPPVCANICSILATTLPHG
jgi:hypothetical protein